MKKSLIIFTIGVLMIISSVVIFDAKENKAKAATQYTIDWEVSEYRNACNNVLYDPNPQNYTCASIGPARWNVNGDVDGKTFTEDWEVVSWATTPGRDISFYNGIYKGMSNGSANTVALYSANVRISCTGCIDERLISYPIKWKVTGTIN